MLKSSITRMMILTVLFSLSHVVQAGLDDLAIERTHQARLDIYWENDSRPWKTNDSDDRHYTNGFAFSVAWHADWAEVLATVPEKIGFFESDSHAVGFTVGQLMFTPEDIDVDTPILDDRPYAGYLYAGLYFQRSNENNFEQYQIELGLIGPSSLAGDTQEFIHSTFNGTDPLGWEHQLKDEPTFQFYYRRKWRTDAWSPFGDDNLWQLQVVPQVNLALGTVHRYVGADATARFGFNLPDDFGPGRLIDLADATGEPRPGFSAYLFGRAGVRLIEHNTFLEGSNYRSSQQVDAKPVVGEAQVGLALAYHSQRVDVIGEYSQTFATEEFDGQRAGDNFGAFRFSVVIWFEPEN